MKQKHHSAPVGSKTTINDVIRWGAELRSLHARIAPYFARASTLPSFPLVPPGHLE